MGMNRYPPAYRYHEVTARLRQEARVVAACKALAVVAVIGAVCALIYCVIVEIADGMIW